MVQVIENRTELQAVIEARRPHPTAPGFELLDVTLVAAEPIPGTADLLSRRNGERLELLAESSSLPAGTLQGVRLHGIASLAGPGVVRLHSDGLVFAPPSA